jgi:hypothetical protein
MDNTDKYGKQKLNNMQHASAAVFHHQAKLEQSWYIECAHSMGSHIVYIINHIEC